MVNSSFLIDFIWTEIKHVLSLHFFRMNKHTTKEINKKPCKGEDDYKNSADEDFAYDCKN